MGGGREIERERERLEHDVGSVGKSEQTLEQSVDKRLQGEDSKQAFLIRGTAHGPQMPTDDIG